MPGDDRDEAELGPLNRKRIARRHDVPTIPIHWKIPKRRSGGLARRKPVKTEAAVIEVSVVGAGIVCPDTHEALVGSKAWVQWGDLTGWVIIRRAHPYEPAPHFTFYGVEYVEAPSELGRALFQHGVGDPAGQPVPDPPPTVVDFQELDPLEVVTPEPPPPLEFRPPPTPLAWDDGSA